jgi:hypothetical protein
MKAINTRKINAIAASNAKAHKARSQAHKATRAVTCGILHTVEFLAREGRNPLGKTVYAFTTSNDDLNSARSWRAECQDHWQKIANALKGGHHIEALEMVSEGIVTHWGLHTEEGFFDTHKNLLTYNLAHIGLDEFKKENPYVGEVVEYLLKKAA